MHRRHLAGAAPTLVLGLAAAAVPLIFALAGNAHYFLDNLERDAGWKGAVLVAVATAAVVVVLRAKPRWPAPGAWLGAGVASAAGGLILRTFGDAYLPRNGEDLGWTRPELSVVIPPDAWGALRPLAANLAVLAIAAAIAVLAVGVARWVVGAARARESVRPGKPATTGPPH